MYKYLVFVYAWCTCVKILVTLTRHEKIFISKMYNVTV